MAALAASSSQIARLTSLERRCITSAGVAGICGLVARPGLLQLSTIPAHELLFQLGAVAFAAATVTGFVALGRRPRRDRSAGFCVAYSTALLFPLPVFIFGSPYAAVGGLTIGHGLQYLLLLSLVAGRPIRVGFLWAFALSGGIALNLASHLHGAASAGRLLFGAFLGISMWHFVVDAGLWRLSDPLARAFVSRSLPYLIATARPPIDRQPI